MGTAKMIFILLYQVFGKTDKMFFDGTVKQTIFAMS